jgi:hypothetical protein
VNRLEPKALSWTDNFFADVVFPELEGPAMRITFVLSGCFGDVIGDCR